MSKVRLPSYQWVVHELGFKSFEHLQKLLCRTRSCDTGGQRHTGKGRRKRVTQATTCLPAGWPVLARFASLSAAALVPLPLAKVEDAKEVICVVIHPPRQGASTNGKSGVRCGATKEEIEIAAL